MQNSKAGHPRNAHFLVSARAFSCMNLHWIIEFNVVAWSYGGFQVGLSPSPHPNITNCEPESTIRAAFSIQPAQVSTYRNTFLLCSCWQNRRSAQWEWAERWHTSGRWTSPGLIFRRGCWRNLRRNKAQWLWHILAFSSGHLIECLQSNKARLRQQEVSGRCRWKRPSINIKQLILLV